MGKPVRVLKMTQEVPKVVGVSRPTWVWCHDPDEMTWLVVDLPGKFGIAQILIHPFGEIVIMHTRRGDCAATEENN